MKDIMGQDIVSLRQYYIWIIASSIIGYAQYMNLATPIEHKKLAAKEIVKWADALIEAGREAF
jgi:hypothetical protein